QARQTHYNTLNSQLDQIPAFAGMTESDYVIPFADPESMNLMRLPCCSKPERGKRNVKQLFLQEFKAIMIF
ncbi:MAG TPA: hypothetical protein PKI71_10240, partial [Candidatus Rifleibacterium sp.]|nr:hypothetical protein [Candidatus Rifleibacterium sp.]